MPFGTPLFVNCSGHCIVGSEKKSVNIMLGYIPNHRIENYPTKKLTPNILLTIQECGYSLSQNYGL